MVVCIRKGFLAVCHGVGRAGFKCGWVGVHLNFRDLKKSLLILVRLIKYNILFLLIIDVAPNLKFSAANWPSSTLYMSSSIHFSWFGLNLCELTYLPTNLTNNIDDELFSRFILDGCKYLSYLFLILNYNPVHKNDEKVNSVLLTFTFGILVPSAHSYHSCNLSQLVSGKTTY